MKTRSIRRISQIIFLSLFLALIFLTAYPGTDFPTDVFLHADPLIALASGIASRGVVSDTIVLAVVVVVITLILGRVFCGWICPLGSTLDIADRVFYRRRRQNKARTYRQLKYYILVGVLVIAVFTSQIVYFLDPISLFTRTIVLGIIAPIQMALRWLNDAAANWSASSFGPAAWFGTKVSDFLGARAFVSAPQLYFRSGLLVFAIFAVIVALNSISRRFWCRNLCPLGALLGLLSYFPILRRIVGVTCNECSRCASECKMSAIPENPRLTRSTECIECFDCVALCPQDSIRFALRLKPERHPETALDLSRRRILQGAGFGLALVGLIRTDPGRKLAIDGQMPLKLSSDTLIRPPGSVVEDKFIARCVRCGMCMKACPTNGLQPAFHEAGIEGFWTPILVPRIGYCQEDCNLCGEVCPTNAIEPFTVREKKHIFIGTANVNRSTCIAWFADKKCLVCDEHCSYKAVYWKEVDGIRRPFVDEKKCVGCGICEAKCPIQPVAAIRVYALGDKRHMTREEQKAWSQM